MTGHGIDIGATLAVANELVVERAHQNAKWGEQNHPSLPERVYSNYGLPSQREMKATVDANHRAGHSDWLSITLEEICEAVEAGSEAALRAELVQAGAVIVAWIECIDRRRERQQHN